MERQEHILEFPVEGLKTLAGLSLDIGGSVCKVVYRHKDDWEELQKTKPEPKMGKLRLTWLSTEDSDQAFQMLKENCHILRTEETPTPEVFTTGVGSSERAKSMEEVLNIKVTNISEMDCFMDAFVYLSQTLPADDFILPPRWSLQRTSYKLAKAKIDAHREQIGDGHFEDIDFNSSDEGEGTRYSLPRPLGGQVAFPAILVMCGSAFGAMLVEQTGHYTMMDMAMNGGRTLLGLGSLLTPAKTYDGLIDLAEKGGGASRALDVGAEKPGDFIYHLYKTHGLNTEGVSPEDRALALLNMVTQELAQMVLYSALRSKCRHVFFCGSIFNRELVRDLLTIMLTSKMVFVDSVKEQPKVDFGFHFIRYGAHLGALGALITPLLPATDTATKQK